MAGTAGQVPPPHPANSGNPLLDALRAAQLEQQQREQAAADSLAGGDEEGPTRSPSDEQRARLASLAGMGPSEVGGLFASATSSAGCLCCALVVAPP